MRVVVTRPEREASLWAEALAARGFAPLVLPLIEIVPERDVRAVQAIQAAWQRLGDYRAAMFVSPNAVTGFYASKPAAAPGGWAVGAMETRAWAPGPGTAAALREQGWPAAVIDAPAADGAQFDSEALWPLVRAQVQGQPGARVLLVRGGDAEGRPAGRDWLVRQLAAEGVAADTLQVYRRRAPSWSEAERLQARQTAADGAVWLFSSSEAIANLAQAVPGQAWGAARAVATHPRIAQAARHAGFGVVTESRPALEAVVASIESLR